MRSRRSSLAPWLVIPITLMLWLGSLLGLLSDVSGMRPNFPGPMPRACISENLILGTESSAPFVRRGQSVRLRTTIHNRGLQACEVTLFCGEPAVRVKNIVGRTVMLSPNSLHTCLSVRHQTVQALSTFDGPWEGWTAVDPAGPYVAEAVLSVRASNHGWTLIVVA